MCKVNMVANLGQNTLICRYYYTSFFAHLRVVFHWVCIIFRSSFAFDEFHEFITSILQFSFEIPAKISCQKKAEDTIFRSSRLTALVGKKSIGAGTA